MSKRRYSATEFNAVDWMAITERVGGARTVFGVDVAKEDFVAALLDAQRTPLVTLKWRHPQQTPALLAQLARLAQRATLEVVMEPSGTYGDALRWQLSRLGIAVYRISPKRVHDAAEVYDGVPSLHDAKAAHVIGHLHLEGASQPWREPSLQRRELSAHLRLLELYKARERAAISRLEAQLSRHWPELVQVLEPGSAALARLIATFGEAARVAAQPAAAAALLRRASHAALAEEKIALVLTSATTTLGLPPLPAERALLQRLARELCTTRAALRRLERQVESQVVADATLTRMATVVGKTTSAVLTAAQGLPQDYPSAASYVKSLGLNLKERSSGKHKGQLKITKRGPGVSRHYLHFAAMRWVYTDAQVHAWYARKVRRDGGLTGKALIAVMRKLAKALWHVARGEPFEPCKLFDPNRSLRAV
jgi:transposase